MPEEKLHIKYRSWSCPKAVRSATYMCGQCQGSLGCSAVSGKLGGVETQWRSSAGLLKEIKNRNYIFLRGFTRLFLELFFYIVNLEKILLFITQCLSGKCFCKSGYKLKSICELQIVQIPSLWNFT